MSKLSKLIKELCPEGVEYRPLGEIGSFERGRRFVKADAVESDGIPCVHYGELYTHYGLWANVHKSQIRSDIQTKLRYAEKNDVIIVGAGENNIDIGIAVAWLGDYKVAVHDACYIFKHQQDPKYISYLLRTNTYHQQIKKFVSEGKICSISAENLAKAVLPFPPVMQIEKAGNSRSKDAISCAVIAEDMPTANIHLFSTSAGCSPVLRSGSLPTRSKRRAISASILRS